VPADVVVTQAPGGEAIAVRGREAGSTRRSEAADVRIWLAFSIALIATSVGLKRYARVNAFCRKKS